MKAKLHIAYFCSGTQLLRQILGNLWFRTPTDCLVLKRIQAFFTEKSGNVWQVCSHKAKHRWNPCRSKTGTLSHQIPAFFFGLSNIKVFVSLNLALTREKLEMEQMN